MKSKKQIIYASIVQITMKLAGTYVLIFPLIHQIIF